MNLESGHTVAQRASDGTLRYGVFNEWSPTGALALVTYEGRVRKWKAATLLPVNDARTVRLRGGARLNKDWSVKLNDQDHYPKAHRVNVTQPHHQGGKRDGDTASGKRRPRRRKRA